MSTVINKNKVHKPLVISTDSGWEYVFRKENGRPIELMKRHVELGQLGGWQVAKNFCLKALISDTDLAKYFKMTASQFRPQQ